MTLRCQACDKPLLRFAVAVKASDGTEYGWGPVCARAVVVRKRKQTKPRAAASVPARDPYTRDWVNEAAVAA